MTYATRRAKNSDAAEVTSKYYLSNSKLLPAVLRAKEQQKVTNELAEMLMMLATKYAQRPCFSGYSYKEDMISEALTNLCQNALKFNPEKSNNPFAYYTTCINSSFLQFLNVEKKHRRIRDQLLVDLGENPSYGFADEVKAQTGESSEWRGEMAGLKQDIEDAGKRLSIEAAREKMLAAEAAELKARTVAFELPVELELERDPEPISLLGFEEEIIDDEPISLGELGISAQLDDE